MKLVIRIFAMCVVFTGLTAASFTPADSLTLPSHLSAVMLGPGPLSLPIPTCGPGVPTCTPHGPGAHSLQ